MRVSTGYSLLPIHGFARYAREGLIFEIICFPNPCSKLSTQSEVIGEALPPELWKSCLRPWQGCDISLRLSVAGIHSALRGKNRDISGKLTTSNGVSRSVVWILGKRIESAPYVITAWRHLVLEDVATSQKISLLITVTPYGGVLDDVVRESGKPLSGGWV